MPDKNLIKAGTRGSKLALAQTDWVINKLKSFYPELEIEKVIIKPKEIKFLILLSVKSEERDFL